MRLLVRHWQNTGTNGQQDTVVAENLLGKHTRARAADTLRRTFLPRFVNGRPPQAWKMVRALEDRHLPIDSRLTPNLTPCGTRHAPPIRNSMPS